ncbi:MAG TPA: fumarylacetoacetate hydrolase family protein, partial [Pyrinomonadaceae bacterium]|nr:fumarylacetoacetate hydrolase family protein [Pyrinomonadaceae bacterium]
MRLAVFKHDDGQRIGIAPTELSGVIIDSVAAFELLGLKSPGTPLDLLSLLRSSVEPNGYFTQLKQVSWNDDVLSEARLNIKDLKLEAPIARPGKIICLAGNYREHIIESGFVAPKQSAVFTPQLFLKPSTAIIGDGDDIIIGSQNTTVGWETELAV